MPSLRYWDGTQWVDLGGGGGEAIPVGAVMAWTGSTIPSDYLLANGQQVSEQLYPQLATFAAQEVSVGNSLWTITGSTPNRTVTVPDLRDRFIYGQGAATFGSKAGATGVALAMNEITPHYHDVRSLVSQRPSDGATMIDLPQAYMTASAGMPGGPAGLSADIHWEGPFSAYVGNPTFPTGQSVYGSIVHSRRATQVTGETPAQHNNMPPYVTLAWVIKARAISPGGGGGAPEVWVGTDAPTPRANYDLWIDTDAVPAVTAGGMDVWHVVGDAATGLGTTFQNSWLQYPGEVPVAFRKDPLGKVQMRGTIYKVAAQSANEAMFTLPVGYRPPASGSGFQRLPVSINMSSAGAIYLAPDGRVQTGQAEPANSYWDLAGIEFDTDTVSFTPTLGITTIPLVSALPPAPYDGQEIYFLADATNGVVWHLRYRAASASTYKWECLGGFPKQGTLLAPAATTGTGSSFSTTLGDGLNASNVIVPLAGDYWCDWTCSIYSGNTGYNSAVGVGRASGVDSSPQAYTHVGVVGGSVYQNANGSGRVNSLAANGLIALWYLYCGTTFTATNRQISVTPIRVG